MTSSNEIGFKAGLEVHQQLETKKLFCRCPSQLREDEPHFAVRRRLRAVAGESGKKDVAALEAESRNQTFIYHGYKDSNCLVELDEEPPHDIDEKALDTVLQIALMTNARIARVVPVMRKLVIDGSNTSAFQRTALLATNGRIESNNRPVGIQTIVLEEDSARPMQKNEHEIHYRLDRLGIPLVEIATEPGYCSPEELEQGARAIGTLLRRTCAVKRGLGTIRQDLNISITGGARVEIKGVQELDRISEFAQNEIRRQQGLLEIKNSLQQKKVSKSELDTPIVDLTHLFVASESKLLSGKPVAGIRIPRAAGLLGMEIQPERRFGSELSDYAKRRSKTKGIVHSDENLAKYPLHNEEIQIIARALGCQDDDAFVLCAGAPLETQQGLRAVQDRLKMALDGVPNETRNALENGSSEYLRPIASAARMYPETDEPFIRIHDQKIDSLKNHLPKSVSEREKAYAALGLSKQLADKMKLDNHAIFFETLCDLHINPTTAAVLLLETLPSLERQNIPSPDQASLRTLLELERDQKIDKKSFSDILTQAYQTKKNIEETSAAFLLQAIDENHVREQIQSLLQNNHELIEAKGKGALGGLMGDAMKKLGKKIPGVLLSRILAEELEKKIHKP